MSNSKKKKLMMEKLTSQKGKEGLIWNSRDITNERKLGELKRIAKRINFKKATEEEKIKFEELKKDLNIKNVYYDKYDKKYRTE